MWYWEEHSILNATSNNTPPKDIFLAVCNEIGRSYQGSEMRYTKSKREVTWQGKNLYCSFNFWSSHSNMRGHYVNFEIVTNIYSQDITNMDRKGILSFSIRPKNFDVHVIDFKKFNEIISFIDNTCIIAQSLDTKEGLEAYLLTTPKQVFIEMNSNNCYYLKKFDL